MSEISRSYDIGNDVFGRRTVATRERRYDGKTGWTIKRYKGGQRDDDESVALLTDAQLVELGRIAAQ